MKHKAKGAEENDDKPPGTPGRPGIRAPTQGLTPHDGVPSVNVIPLRGPGATGNRGLPHPTQD